jgi:hypothetical protein
MTIKKIKHHIDHINEPHNAKNKGLLLGIKSGKCIILNKGWITSAGNFLLTDVNKSIGSLN